MGYSTSYHGEILVDPPLTWAEIKDSPYLPDRARHDRDVMLRVKEDTVETDDGTLVRRTADAIVPITDDAYKGYDIVEHVQEILDRHGNGHTFSGRFNCYGEESGDMWRLEVKDGRAVKVQPRIVWPDGTEEVPR